MMIGGLKRSSSSVAILAAAGLFAGGVAMSPAQAADLGGDCCADLEERVAELEATAVRHANRNVRLTLSGQVNSQLMYFDNGIDSDVFVMDSDESSTRIRLAAEGTIQPGVTAGLIIEFDIEIAGGANIGPLDGDEGDLRPDDDAENIQLRRANWWVNGSLGRISIGQGSMASDGFAEVSFANTWVGSVGYGLGVTNIGAFTAVNLGGRSWFALGTDNDTSRRNRVRYDTPTFAGFTLSGAWGEDDEYDVALRYANEFGGIRVAAALAYHVDEDDETAADDRDTERWGGSLAIMHNPSGIHLQGGYNVLETDIDGGGEVFSRTHWWVAAGIQFRVSSLGISEVTVDYIRNDNDTSDGLGVLLDTVEYDSYGIGFAQNIDAIGANLYLSYRFHEAEVTASNGGLALGNSDDFQQIQFGMRIRY